MAEPAAALIRNQWRCVNARSDQCQAEDGIVTGADALLQGPPALPVCVWTVSKEVAAGRQQRRGCLGA